MLRKFFLVIAGFFFVLSLYAKVVNYPRGQDITTLDPAVQWNAYTSEVLANIYEGLVEFKGTYYKVSPLLAERWEALDDGRRWRFYLRKGVKFHDGSSFNADSVIFSFNRQRKKKFVARYALLPFLKEVRKIDEYTVEFILEKPYAALPSVLANPFAFIVKPDENGEITVGTGPFKLKSWVKGKYVLIVTNKHYWGSPPGIDGVRFLVVRDSYLRVLQLKNGNADVLSRLSRREYEDIKNQMGIKIIKFPELDINYITFNSSRPPFDDLRVRKAVTLLINRNRLVKLVFGELAEPVSLPVPDSLILPFKLRTTGYDPKEAKKLLAQAGYTEGFSCNLIYLLGSPYRDIVTMVARNLLEAKILVKPVALPYRKLVKRVVHGDFDMVIGGWVADVPEVGNFIYSTYFPLSPRISSNLPYYNEAIKFIEEARSTMDPLKRKELYTRVVKKIMEEYLTVPLYRSFHVVAYREGIKGLEVSPKGYVLFRKVKGGEN